MSILKLASAVCFCMCISVHVFFVHVFFVHTFFVHLLVVRVCVFFVVAGSHGRVGAWCGEFGIIVVAAPPPGWFAVARRRFIGVS